MGFIKSWQRRENHSSLALTYDSWIPQNLPKKLKKMSTCLCSVPFLKAYKTLEITNSSLEHSCNCWNKHETIRKSYWHWFLMCTRCIHTCWCWWRSRSRSRHRHRTWNWIWTRWSWNWIWAGRHRDWISAWWRNWTRRSWCWSRGTRTRGWWRWIFPFNFKPLTTMAFWS